MSYVVFGRKVANEYLALGTFATVFGGAFLATRGGKKDAPAKPTTVQQAKESVPINGTSDEEEKFILQFIKEAEASSPSSSH
ncbi:hypothetical protein NLJ89_g2675 [Agrocybe chaxingu]|uniref:Uncharacterized protein n=1 Tax=Agrocybe chaxingu TaxID=84603 RepID=A0A9W8MYS8_9AGAR|nr:hypothetical protein NLJ89_g2675 [Agrocybe chaxingu]